MRSPSLILLTCAATVVAAVGCGDSSQNRGPRSDRQVVSNLRSRSQGDATSTQSSGGGMEQADGWGTITGRFVYGGPAPARMPVSVTKDVQFCGQHNLLEENLVVSPDGGVANVVVFLRTRNPKVHESYEEKIKQPVVLDNRDCRFEPHVLLVHTSQPIEILNSDPVAHNTNVQFQRNPSFSEGVASNSSVTKTMTVAETLPAPAACNVHPWMGGWVIVKDNPYMAVTDENGKFVIENVPAGVELEFQVWHERGAGSQNAVDGSGPVANVDRGRFTITVPKDGEVDLKDITLPPSSFR